LSAWLTARFWPSTPWRLRSSYDVIAIPVVSRWLAEWQQAQGLEAGSLFDARGLSLFSFGLALYLTVLLRTRPK
jgi:hypothetical protein